jgi:hypothetical protein
MTKAAKSEVPKKGLKSSTSVGTEEPKQQQAILELGRELIKDLDSRDLTAKWMSAYLSELMVAAETEPERKAECKDLILELWRERRSLPGGDPLERYSKTISTLEALLKTGQPLFEVWLPRNSREVQKKDWANLARRLRRHTDFLAGTSVKEAIKVDDLTGDELVDIAHLADPDDQTHILNILRIAVREPNGDTQSNDVNDHVIETLGELRATLDDFEAKYEENVRKNKTIN